MSHSAEPARPGNLGEHSAGRAQTVAIIGGGISGLAAAGELRTLAPGIEIRLFESAPRLGGVLHTEREAGYLLEHSADNFITDSPWGVDFCRHLGIADDLLPTSTGNRRAGIVSHGRIEPLPQGFALLAPTQLMPVLASRLLSFPGKLRLALEYFVPRRRDLSDESFASFARRRLGREAYERIAQPLVSGIYTADPERLSMQAALPRFVDMERKYRSLVRAARHIQEQSATSASQPAIASGPRYSLFVAPREGMQALVEAAARSLPAESVLLSAEVQKIAAPSAQQSRTRWNIAWRSAGSANQQQLEADAVLLAVRSWAAAKLVAPWDPALASELDGIDYAGCTIALVGCRLDQLERTLDGFGFVVPEVERRSILACSYASTKFPGRAPDGQILLRVFVGGACHPELNELTDGRLQDLVLNELRELLGFRGAPNLFRIVRWARAMPQYYVGHRDRLARIAKAAEHWPTLALAGNAYHGVGIPHCIHSGQTAARKLADVLLAGV